MSEPLHSASWYRVAKLKPELRRHARIHRHQYRGNTWFVLQDLATGAFHRFTPEAYRILGLLDGRRSVDEVWSLACEELGDDAPTQDSMIRLLAQLHSANLLSADVSPDSAELLRRQDRQQRGALLKRMMSPFAIQLPLLDPDAFLQRTVRYVRPFTGALGLALWLPTVLCAIVIGAVHADALTEGFVDRVLTAQNLVMLWLLFPVIKALHEFGHAYLARSYGGEVHEMGVMFLVFTPIPYVDATSASAFPHRSQRVAVGAGGMLVEVFVAALAVFVWVNAEPGLVRSLAFNTIMIAGVTTVLFNANPLLRFDGYYILSDFLEIPNLRQRANAYVGYLVERYAMRQASAEPPEASQGERGWLLAFAILSFLYRMTVIAAIALFVLDWSLVLGVALLLTSAIGWIVMPAVRGVRFLAANPRLAGRRGRAVALTVGVVATIGLVLSLLPFPLRTQAEGVVWIPDEANVRAGADGFVVEVVATPGAQVSAGDPLLILRDPAVIAEVRAGEAGVRELEARYLQRREFDVAEAKIIDEELRYARMHLERERERAGQGRLVAGHDGTFVLPRARDLPGRFVHQGQRLGQIVDLETITVRAVVTQADIQLVRDRMRAVEVRLSERIAEVVPATLRRVVPSASDRLPSTALGSQGGGGIAIDPTKPDGATALERLFVLELELPASSGVVNAGGRVYLRFDLGFEPLASQWYRRLRQLFLTRFDV